jgi:mannose/fructose/N-acetylgalactosamine-specific phosphotransferase system component IIB
LIVLVRVDNRLLHGQIFEAWVPRLKVRAVQVADDTAARSPLARAAMTLAVPPGLKAEVRAVADLGWEELARSPERTLVIFRDVSDLARAVESGLTPDRAPVVNLGNIHFAEGRRAVTPSVFLSQSELDTVLRLARLGFMVEARSVPAEAPVSPETMVERYKAAS